MWLVVDGRIYNRELFAYGRHKVRSCVYGCVLTESIVKANQGGRIVAYRAVSLGKRTPGSSCLIRVAIACKEHQGTLCEVSGEEAVWHIVYVYIFKLRIVGFYQVLS